MLSARRFSSPLRGLILSFFFLLHVAGFCTAQAQSLRFVPVFHKAGPFVGGVGSILNNANGLATDLAGNLYISDSSNHVVRKLDPTLTATIFAGNGTVGTTGDGGPATSATMTTPLGIAADLLGNVYVVDASVNAVRKIDRNGVITLFAGNGAAGSTGDGGLATAAQIVPRGIATDSHGNVFIVDIQSATIRVVRPSGIISRYAGGGNLVGSAADNGPALMAQIAPGSLTSDINGNLFVGDGNTVREITKLGAILTYAGTGVYGSTGDGGSAVNAQIHSPYSLAMDASGNLFIGDAVTRKLRMVDSASVITTVAGNGQSGFVNDGLPADKESMGVPSAIAADNAGNVFIAAGTLNAIYELVMHPEVFPQTKVGLTSSTQRLLVENMGGTTINLASVVVGGDFHIAATPLANNLPCGTILPLDSQNFNYCTLDVVFTPTAEGIRSFPVTITSNDVPSQLVQTLTSTGLGSALAMTSGQMFMVAGRYHTTSDPFDNGDGGPAKSAALNGINGIAVNSSGDIFFSEYAACQIRRVDGHTGILTLYAGKNPGSCLGPLNFVSGDGGQALNAVMNGVSSLAFDSGNSLYVSTTWDSRIRAISPAGVITTFAGVGVGSGNTAACGFSADGGQATAATLCTPNGIAFDKFGNMFFAETGNSLVRKIDTNGVLTTIAGNHALGLGFSGDGGLGTAAQLNQPQGVTVNDAGDVFIADTYNHVIRKVAAGTNIITTVAGAPGVQGYRGDGGLATGSKLALPDGLSINAAGDVFIADRYNHVVRKMNTAGIITTVAGTALVQGGYNGDGHAATATQLRYPNQVAISPAGFLYVSDNLDIIRQMSPDGSLIFQPQDVNTTSNSQNVTLSNIGNMPMHFDSQIPTGITGDFSLSGGTCDFNAVLAVGASCNVNLTFTPTVAGGRSGIFAFYDDGVATPQYVGLFGTGLLKQAQTIQFTAIPNKVYGDPSFTLVATTNSGLPIALSVLTGNATVTLAGSTVTIHGTGPVTIAADQAGDVSWTPAAEVTRSFTVSPALLTVIAQSASSQTGQPIAPLTSMVSGFVYGEGSSVLSGASALSTTATSNGVAGAYPITVSAGSIQAANYTFAYQPGTYTLTAATGGTPDRPKIVLVTTFTLTRVTNQTYQATIKVSNTGTLVSLNTVITSAKLAGLSGSPLTVPLGSIPAGSTATAFITFPASAGAPGTLVVEQVTGTYTGGTFGGSGHLNLP